MKAVVYERYGTPDVLHLAELEKPKIQKDHEVLVRVHASSINSWDWDLLRGRFPRSGLRRPKNRILGADVAGRVEAVGGDVRRFRPGDEVFGDINQHGWGGFGEYVSVPERALAAKSSAMTFEQAASIPQAAGLALQALRKAGVRSGSRVLFNGAGGGVGTFGIQMARSLGAEVTGVDHAGKLDALRELGADRVVDYTREDFTADGYGYDILVDVMASRSARAYGRALRPEGRCEMIGGSFPRILRLAAFGSLLMTGGRKVRLLFYRPSIEDLAELNELFESGKLVPVIDRTFSLSEAPEAMRHYGRGTFVGKIVINVGGDSGS